MIHFSESPASASHAFCGKDLKGFDHIATTKRALVNCTACINALRESDRQGELAPQRGES